MTVTPTEQRIAHPLTILLHPMATPTVVALYILFSPGMISALFPADYRWLITALIALLTILIPLFFLLVFKWTQLLISPQKKEKITTTHLFITMLVCFFLCFKVLRIMGTASLLTTSILGCTLTLFLTFLIHRKWHIAAHSAGWGSVSGTIATLLAMQLTSGAWFFMISLLLFGLSGTAVILLKKHTPAQVYTGYLLGFITQLITLLLLSV